MMTIAIIIPIVLLIIKLVYDYRLWLGSKPVNHKKEWLILAACCIPSIVLFTLQSNFAWYFAAPLSGLMIAFFIWLFFDGLYNKLRGFGFWFTGSDDPDDAKTDNFLQSLKLWQHIAIKVGGLLLLILTYILC